jgi:hypothetical protein
MGNIKFGYSLAWILSLLVKPSHMPTTTKKGTDNVKKGYNEKNPSQPQGAFKPGSTEQAIDKKKPVAAKLHGKQQELDKDKE